MRALRESNVDVALLQEVRLPPGGWEGEHYGRGACVVQLSDRVTLVPFRNIPLGRRPAPDEIAVSAPGTLAAARVVPEVGHPFVAVSVYARWEKPHPSTPTNWGVGYADAMAHRAISDLSTFIGHIDPSTHRIVVAGDFNMIRGATDSNRLALPARHGSVFARFEALGFASLGPDYPAGRRAEPTPSGLPLDTANVPTYHTTRRSPATAAN